jgi:hypothetical protein
MPFIIEHGDNIYKHDTLEEVFDRIFEIADGLDITRLYIKIQHLNNIAIIRGIPDNEEAIIILDSNNREEYKIMTDDNPETEIEFKNVLQKILLQKLDSNNRDEYRIMNDDKPESEIEFKNVSQKNESWLWILILLAIIAIITIIVAGAIYIKK